MTFVDTNVVIDVLDPDPSWFEWSADKLADAAADGAVRIDPIVVAELSRGFASVADLRRALGKFAIAVEPLDDASAFVAGQRFQQFRRTRDAGQDARVLPDFLIGAHALILGVPLLTRDARLYRRFFPELALITPENPS